MLVLFFALQSAFALKLDFNRLAVFHWIESNAVKNERGNVVGFKESPALTKNDPHLVHSYCAVAILK